MKPIIALLIVALLSSCDEKPVVDPQIEVARQTMLRDAIRERDAAEKKARLAEMELSIMKQEVGELRRKLESETHRADGNSELLQAANQRNVENLRQRLEEVSTSRMPSIPRTPAASPVMTRADVAPAVWIPPQRHMMDKLIRQRAEQEWKDNYTMVEYEIKKQSNALNQLLELNRWVANRDLLAKAAAEWKDDYSMMLYEFNRQSEAKKRLGR